VRGLQIAVLASLLDFRSFCPETANSRPLLKGGALPKEGATRLGMHAKYLKMRAFFTQPEAVSSETASFLYWI
jgi:hypothetical protein